MALASFVRKPEVGTVTREQRGSIKDRQEDTSGKDRRGRRLALSCRVFVFGEDDFEAEGTLMDISTSGCRAVSTVEVQRGMIVKLSVFLPDHQWPLRVEEAIVRWTNGQEFGVEFTSIRLAQRERLRTLIMKAKM
jgi:hypothetical protein